MAETLHSIHSLQIRDNKDKKILSLQAELENVYVKYGEVEARSKQVSEVNRGLLANIDRLKAQLNTAVAELNESKNVGRQLLEQLGSMEEELSSKKVENSRILKDFEDRNEEALNEMDKMVQGFEQEKSLLYDNIKHLEDLNDNLEKTVSEKTEIIHSQKHKLEETQSKEEVLKDKLKELLMDVNKNTSVATVETAPVRVVDANNSMTHTSRLYVRNIPFRWEERHVACCFDKYGISVEKIEITYNDRGSKGQVFVSVKPLDAEKAKSQMNNSKHEGRIIQVMDADPKRSYNSIIS